MIDLKIMKESIERSRAGFTVSKCVHMVNQDYKAMARDYYALDFLSPDVDVSPIVPELRSFFDDALNSTVKGLALYVDPNLKVLAASYPYFAKRLLIDPNPYLRDTFIELLFKDEKFRSKEFEREEEERGAFVFALESVTRLLKYLTFDLLSIIDKHSRGILSRKFLLQQNRGHLDRSGLKHCKMYPIDVTQKNHSEDIA
nr:hypothetical protein [Tanacetum cinerariifolium]